MENFYEQVDRLVKELERGDAPDASARALAAHQVLDVYVKKLQVIKECLEIMSDECLLFTEGRNPFPALYDRRLTRELLHGIDRIEEDLCARRFRDTGGSEAEIERMMELIDGHVERVCRLGDALRNTDALAKKMGV